MTDESRTGHVWARLEEIVAEINSMAAGGQEALADRVEQAKRQLDGMLGELQSGKDALSSVSKAALAALHELRESTAKERERLGLIPEMENALVEAGKALEAEKARVMHLEKGLAEAEQATLAAQKRVSELDKSLGAANEAVDAAKARASELAYAEEDKNKKLKAANARVGELERELLAAHEESEKAVSRLAELEGPLNERTNELDEARARISELQASVAEKDKANETAAGRVAGLEAALAEKVGELDGRGRRVEELESELAGFESRRRDELGALEAQMADSVASRDSLVAEVERLRADLDGVRGHAGRLEELEAALQAEREQVIILTERVKEETARGTKSALAQQLTEALQDSEKAHSEIAELKVEIQRLNRLLAERSEADSPAVVERNGKIPKLGGMLVESGEVTAEQLQEALQEQRNRPGVQLAAILVEKGFASEETVARAAARQGGVEFVNLGDVFIDLEATRLIPRRLAVLHSCIPIKVSDEALTVAMANPLDVVAMEDVERTCQRRVEPVVCTLSAISAAIDRMYEAEEA